ncbi:fasciclin domain-containing protein [Psychromicrobium lacuslunae]|uniref:Fasciclin n=1 Tax=Psychromicrobium lacuslunae TaxID=1618207 RepID=A0A0D4BYT9_9MICC|nr:fasciclin domain-containing protein [Psychromicrobium lacuslunae]AJT41276.1 fasciclin [Psychromicrobium lacuslunae]
MKLAKHTSIAVFAVAAAATLTLSACGGGSSTSGSSSAAPSSSSSSPSMATETPSMAASGMVGPGCSAYASQVPSGPGSVSGMAADPVAVAASNNPLLKTLVAAVSGKLNPKVNLVSTLNGSEFTVFAPVDDAFAKIPAATINGLKTDDKTLSKILTYHVIPGQLSPEQIVGSHKTVEGGSVTVAGSGDNLTVDGSAKVICGGVKTANATVYLIDSVLMPK